jgi:N-acetylglucosamine kinase-like BadF-type ATPase
VSFYLGIDGGGTKTECVVGDDRSVLGSSVEGTIKIRKVGVNAADQKLEAAIHAACKQAGIPPGDIARTCIGLAGSSIPEVADWAYRALRHIVPGDVAVVNDTVIAHRAAFSGGAGVLVIAGTGSNVLGINERGESARAGGWGPIISDEGSGFWIGRRAVAQAMRAHDRGRPTELLNAIKQAWKLSSLEEVVSMANSNPPPDFASLLPEILRCSDRGDAVAQAILRSAAEELAHLALVVMTKLWPDSKEIAIAVTGGVFSHSPQIRQLFAEYIRAERAAVRVNLEPVHPVMGALAIARDGAPSASTANASRHS